MSSGGARVNSGPPPDPNALRRDRPGDKDGWTTLPAGGRTGPAPVWPLGGMLADDQPGLHAQERAVWARIWATPQAVAWDRLGWTHDVALYVRFLVLAELGDVRAAGEARQWSDRLGLNPAAMLRHRWRIGEQVAEPAPSRRAAAARRRTSSRGRLQVVPGGSGGGEG